MVFVGSHAKIVEYHQIDFVASSRPLTLGSKRLANPITQAEQQIRQKLSHKTQLIQFSQTQTACQEFW